MAKKISQREARRLSKMVDELIADRDRQRRRWGSEWSAGWKNIETLTLSAESFAKVSTARLLGHAVIVVPSNTGTQVLFYAERQS